MTTDRDHRILNMIHNQLTGVDKNNIKNANVNANANFTEIDPGNKKQMMENEWRKSSCGTTVCTSIILIFGIFLFVLGALMFKYPLYDFMMMERLEMDPFIPTFGWWKNPEPEVTCKVYIFSVTNPNEFIAGHDKVLKLKEIGPIVYREHLHHENVVFHKQNSTISYTVVRSLEFKEDANEPGILNKTILAVNMATLGAVASMHDAFFGKKLGLNLVLRKHKASPFVNTTIHNYLWNLSDPVLETVSTLVPSMVPTLNVGVLQNIYKNYQDRVNVKYGRKNGPKKFFQINKYNYEEIVPGFPNNRHSCYATLNKSSEGALYPQGLNKDSVLWYFRKTLCRPVPLYFEEEIPKDTLTGYKFNLRTDTYDRKGNLSADCYKGFSKPLPDGLSDLSRCFYHLPMAASFPHFLDRSGEWTKQLEGLNPNPELHESYAVVEPTLGIPMEQAARSQSNLVVHDINGFKEDFMKFKNMVIPIFWLEYFQKDLTPAIINTMHFFVNILPRIQYYVAFAINFFGLGLVLIGLLRIILANKYKITKDLNQNKI